MAKSLQITLMMGGHSAEREVSLSSGAAVRSALQNLGHQVYSANDIAQLQNIAAELIEQGQNVDVVFNLLHGADGEDGLLAAWLQQQGHAFTGCSHSAAVLSWDKNITKMIAEQVGVLTPRGQCVERQQDVLIDGDGPWIVKPADEGSSVGLCKVNQPEQLPQAVEQALKHSDRILIEQFIAGMECTVGMVDGVILPVVGIQPAGELYDYQAKYQSDQTRYDCPPQLPTDCLQALQQDALRVFKALRLESWGRADFIVDQQGKRWFLEINTTPGMTESSLVPKAAAAHGWSFEQLVGKILATANKRVNP